MNLMAIKRITALDQKLEQLKREGEERSAERLAEDLKLPYIDLTRAPVSLEAVRLVSKKDAEEGRVVAIEVRPGKVALAVVNPALPAAKRVIKDLENKKYEVKVFIASYSGVKQAWHFYSFVPEKKEDITGKLGIKKERFEELIHKWHTLEEFQEEVNNTNLRKVTTTTLFEMIIAEALTVRASDIHFEAEEENVRVRFRIDGILNDALPTLLIDKYAGLTSRIKLLSGMKINVRGEPQDGRFTLELTGKDVEFRVSILPSEFGETIVMRVLDPEAINVDLPGLGLRADDLALVEDQMAKPNGLVLNTGPTGSGKTTTLYAFLKHMADSKTKIITIEDPIEYRLDGIEQTQVNPSVDYTFAKGLRAIVRQDPDIILVGEIRDKETAEISMQAALTGHVVFSTLHTNDAVGAVPRLIDLGVKPAIIGPALSMVIAQRLVRTLCEKCKKPVNLSAIDKRKFSKFIAQLPARVDRSNYTEDKFKVFESVGCKDCNGFGFKGRLAVFEFLDAGEKFEEAILKEASEVNLKRIAKDQEMVTMQQDGILKVLSGLTTLGEVERITGKIKW